MAGMGEKLKNEVQAWGVLAIVVVIVSVVLLQFTSSGVGSNLCTFGNGVLGNYTAYNSTFNVCCFENSTAQYCGLGNATPDLVSTTNNFVSALSEPENWVAIAIIALVGFGILRYFNKNKGK